MNLTSIRNGIRMVSLIYSLEEFTEQELITRFEQDNNHVIGGAESLTDYLIGLRQMGSLHYEDGVYSVAQSGECL